MSGNPSQQVIQYGTSQGAPSGIQLESDVAHMDQLGGAMCFERSIECLYSFFSVFERNMMVMSVLC
jgi:hypothetical protein